MRFDIALVMALAQTATAARNLIYADRHTTNYGPKDIASSYTHVALTFLNPLAFNANPPVTFDISPDDVARARAACSPGTKILVSVGGWTANEGFSNAVVNNDTMKTFATNVRDMLKQSGADGVDIDWEFPGGDGDDWKQIPNSDKVNEIPAFPVLLAEIRAAIGDEYLLTAAVPGQAVDMIAFTKENMPKIMEPLDFINIMTYDLMIRRSTHTSHHTGLAASLASVDRYLALGVPPAQTNLGFAYYARWVTTNSTLCAIHPIGCKTAVMEDPLTGADLGLAGDHGLVYPDPPPNDKVSLSWARAQKEGRVDEVGGGAYFWDKETSMFWSWDTPGLIGRKFQEIVKARGMGGAFAWSLGQGLDEVGEWHMRAVTEGVKGMQKQQAEAAQAVFHS